ncbi:hypothetical protein M501DRAFT_991660 [Patellaria atrata CBS 101060]|uniref:Uncharacterized protein n=1 Tax=Patellaria atrata CBS 101060 TaxID=1346257 RepID=A0A9P4VTK1_9PEZI|nr:hypothetical protein M501DRAFT_991660 [Patellaria atrata CBS 101060]
MSDDAYTSFLDKANQDTGTAHTSSSSSSKPTLNARATDTEVPPALKSIDATYTSESDEPFEPVALRWAGKHPPSATEFGELVGKEVVRKGKEEFDPRGEYSGVVRRVREVSCGWGEGEEELGYFWAEEGTRGVWWVVGLKEGGGAVVGVRVGVVVMIMEVER